MEIGVLALPTPTLPSRAVVRLVVQCIFTKRDIVQGYICVRTLFSIYESENTLFFLLFYLQLVGACLVSSSTTWPTPTTTSLCSRPIAIRVATWPMNYQSQSERVISDCILWRGTHGFRCDGSWLGVFWSRMVSCQKHFKAHINMWW